MQPTPYRDPPGSVRLRSRSLITGAQRSGLSPTPALPNTAACPARRAKRGPASRSPFPPYSWRSATAGRTRAARRAGSQQAARVTPRVNSTTAATSGARTRNGTELMK